MVSGADHCHRLSGARGRAGARPRAGKHHWDVHKGKRGPRDGAPHPQMLMAAWGGAALMFVLPLSACTREECEPSRTRRWQLSTGPASQSCSLPQLTLSYLPHQGSLAGKLQPPEGESRTALSPAQDVATPHTKLGYRGLGRPNSRAKDGDQGMHKCRRHQVRCLKGVLAPLYPMKCLHSSSDPPHRPSPHC